MKKIRLILVENHPMMREAWFHVLNTDGRLHVVANCAGHDDAILLCGTEKPDILLFNIGRNLKADLATVYYILQEFPQIKIIGISMDCRPVTAQYAFDMGAHGFVTKSSSRDEMINAILEVNRGNTYLCSEVKELQH